MLRAQAQCAISAIYIGARCLLPAGASIGPPAESPAPNMMTLTLVLGPEFAGGLGAREAPAGSAIIIVSGLGNSTNSQAKVLGHAQPEQHTGSLHHHPPWGRMMPRASSMAHLLASHVSCGSKRVAVGNRGCSGGAQGCVVGSSEVKG